MTTQPPSSSSTERPASPWRRVVSLIASLAILALALHALAGEFTEQGYRSIRHAFQQIDAARIALAFALSLASYACLVGFDAIGLRRNASKVKPLRLIVTAFLANAVGHTLGFAALTGGAVRLRGYGAAGLSLADIGQVVLMSTLGFVFGAWVLLACALMFEPAPAALLLPLSEDAIRAIGAAVAIAFLGLLFAVGREGRTLRLREHALWLPDRRTVLSVTALSVVELALAGGALYVLLAPDIPAASGTSFIGFVGLYLVAVLAGLVSSVPAGIGVFEWSLLKLLPGVAPASLLAAAVAYRITYYAAPLALATLLGLFGSARGPVARRASALRTAWLAIRPWLPHVIALAAFVLGAALIIDGTLPKPRHRLAAAPLSLIETSQLLASLGGVGLLLIGQGLQRRSHAAWALALGVCVLLPLPSWLRGGHWLLALAPPLVAVALWAARREFYRQGALLDEAWSWRWLRNLGLVLIAAVWLLFFAYSHVEYRNELWWEFLVSGNAPRALRAMLLVSVTVIAFGLARMMHAARAPLPNVDEAQLALIRPILASADDSQAHLALTGDKALLLDPEQRGFVMMQRYGGSLISMGDPVGPPEAARALIWRFREEADRLGVRPVFYQVGEQHWQTYLDLGLTLVKLGEEALVPLTDFSLQGPTRADLRQAWNRGKRSGLSFRIAPVEEVEGLLPALEEISDEWLEQKSGDEKGFSLGSFDPDYLRRLPIALVEHENRVVAFANLWTATNGRELSVDLMRHASDAPKGAMDFMFAELLMWGREQGYERFCLGMAPLSGLAQHRLAGRWNRFANLIARHGERFYGFVGLRRFKAKFDPVWRPRYLAAPGGMHLPSALLDVTRLISLDPRRHDEHERGTAHFPDSAPKAQGVTVAPAAAVPVEIPDADSTRAATPS
ncbi:bifunctional lysylphosphatidylglycerol flippase/synthetase MprF [Lysobacter gummosus]|uniref:Bifunctional lysylphosphatidylglycerol flippase/synthetase MprF n=1 Tax=Lysobacter gummosus TaxID=262324 RepID=A0ABY3XFJ4_9GAMM|nr:bifunctional lysylphosphatidylglycerol flippase/synthetase MprF [Lysobacter gummosus]UNP30411.1 bifunctional lysylphosphatidylglycerol flippase/synthetase MprF [Lysobacter gummosus]